MPGARLSQKNTLPVSCAGAAPPASERSAAPMARAPAAAGMAPKPRRSMRAMPAAAAMPLPAQAPQLMLSPGTPCDPTQSQLSS